MPYFQLAWHLENRPPQNASQGGAFETHDQRMMLNAAYYKRAPPTSPIQLIDVAARLVIDHGLEEALGPAWNTSGGGSGSGGDGGSGQSPGEFVLPDDYLISI